MISVKSFLKTCRVARQCRFFNDLLGTANLYLRACWTCNRFPTVKLGYTFSKVCKSWFILHILSNHCLLLFKFFCEKMHSLIAKDLHSFSKKLATGLFLNIGHWYFNSLETVSYQVLRQKKNWKINLSFTLSPSQPSPLLSRCSMTPDLLCMFQTPDCSKRLILLSKTTEPSQAEIWTVLKLKGYIKPPTEKWAVCVARVGSGVESRWL